MAITVKNCFVASKFLFKMAAKIISVTASIL